MTTSATTQPALADPPPTVFERLGEFIVRRARLVLVLFFGGVILAGVVGSQVFAALGSAGYNDPGSDSARAATVLSEEFATSEPILVMAVTSPAGVDDPAATTDARELVAEISATPGVAQVVSYWTSGTPPALRSEDGSIGQVIVYAEPDATVTERTEVAETVMAATGTQQGGLTVATSGAEAVGAAVSETITEDLKLAESVAIPITMIVLLVVFGSLVSAGLPLVVAAGSVLGSFLVLWLITQVTDVSIFGLNLITGLGLGLGIDYALLMVNRFREERARGLAPDRAVVRTVATAGRTVAVSGVTVAVTLAALLFFPQYFLRSFGYAGISVTLLAVLSAITALPAAMALLGARTDSLRIRRGDLAPSDDGAWARVARAVMRRPVLVAVSVTAVLLSIASLALGASFSQVDDRALPADNPATAAASLLRESFPGEEGAPVQVVLAGDGGIRSRSRDGARRDPVGARRSRPGRVAHRGVHRRRVRGSRTRPRERQPRPLPGAGCGSTWSATCHHAAPRAPTWSSRSARCRGPVSRWSAEPLPSTPTPRQRSPQPCPSRWAGCSPSP